MAYNKARAEKKWLKWKEAEEKKLRELGVDEETIQRLHTYDRAEFNRERRYLQRQVEWSPYVDMISAQDLELPVEDVESLMDSIEDTILLKTCRNLLRSIPLQGHTVNPAYHLGRFLVHNPVFGIVRVLDVAIGRLSHRRSPALPLILLLMRRFLLMSRAYHSLNRLRMGASSFSPSAVSMLSETATKRMSCSGKNSSVSRPTSM